MTQTVLLGDIVRVRRGASPRPIQDFIQNTPGIPWVKIADATAANSRFIAKTKEYIKEEGQNNSVSVNPGTLIMSNSATPGLPMIMKIDASVHDGWLILDELKGVDRNWLYYYLLNRRAQSAREASGSVFSNLKTDIVKGFKVDLPDMEYQKKVADILWTIDEKIELNRQMNETLEQMGQALFRHYFIDNPEAEKWETGRLGDLIAINRESIGKDFPHSEIQYIDISSVSTGSIDKYEVVDTKTAPSRAKRIVRDGDIIWATVRPNRRAFSLISDPDENTVVSTGFAVLSPKKDTLGFVYYHTSSQAFTDYLVLHARGAAYPAVTATDFKNAPIIIPNNKSLAAFNNLIAPNLQKIGELKKEIQTLTALRDSLLPRLINGKVRV